MPEGAPSRPSAPEPHFSGATIDRAAALRHAPDRIAELLGGDDVRAVLCSGSDVAVSADGRTLARLPWSGPVADAVLLGLEDGHPLVAVEADGLGDHRAMSLREAGTALDGSEAGLAAYLVGLMAWHRRHPHCSVCGARSTVSDGGLARRCPHCGASHFPRTDPVVIMTVEWEGRLLLGSRAGWPDERYSILAGFVSPGETLEEAVVREVQEESRILARDPVYVTSQPWPFPASLMLGFHAISDGGEPSPGDDDELSDVRWFSHEEVVAMQRGQSEFVLPGEVSIARLLIDHWVAGGA